MKFKNLFIACLFPLLCQGQDVKSFKQLNDRIDVTLSEGMLSIYPLTENAIRIKYLIDTEVPVPELIFTSSVPTPKFQVFDTDSKLELKGKNIVVELNKQTGKLSFSDIRGNIFLSEKAETRKLVPDSVMGEPCFMAEQSFESPADEYLFGLGQFQDGHYNLRNITRKLTQVNSQISIPFILFKQRVWAALASIWTHGF